METQCFGGGTLLSEEIEKFEFDLEFCGDSQTSIFFIQKSFTKHKFQANLTKFRMTFISLFV